MIAMKDLTPDEGTTVGMAGRGIVYWVVGEQTGGAFALIEATLGPRRLGAPPHLHHREDEVICLLEGELMVQIGERVICARPGSVIFKPRGVFHTVWNPTMATARFLEFISPAGLEEYFMDLAGFLPEEAPPDGLMMMELAEGYEVESDMSRLPEILRHYQVESPALY
jgi:quercetin dioxygenase-like cupin family protein